MKATVKKVELPVVEQLVQKPEEQEPTLTQSLLDKPVEPSLDLADCALEENFEVPQPPSPQLESKPDELEPTLTQSLLDEPVEPALD